VSPGFIASDYIYDHEIPAIKARHLKGALVLPVVLKRCMWQFIANALQALPMHKGHIKTRVLIIEDEAFIAEDMSSLFRAVGHEIIGVASTSSEAITLAETNYPGLIIADIQLRDGSSGLAAVAEILDSISVPVIFVTAYPERFLTASRPEPAFLISKPYQPAMLLAVASQALFFQRNARRRAKRK
jgi:CheY-like chemotaxis protein